MEKIYLLGNYPVWWNCHEGYMINCAIMGVETFPIIYMSEAMANHKIIISCAVKRKVNGFCILVDDLFLNLSDSLREFIIAHEIGHIVLEHFADNKRDINQELAADEFAAEHVSIDAVHQMTLHMLNIFPSESSKSIFEFEQRIKKLIRIEILKGDLRDVEYHIL